MATEARAPERRPRLAYVVKMFPRFSETFILHELLELERLGHEITIYSLKRPAGGPVHPALSRLRARVVYLPERPRAWLPQGVAAAARLIGRSPADTARILGYVATRGTHQAWKRFFQGACMARELERHPVDRLHAHFASAPTRVAMFAARFRDLPFSFTAHAKDIYQEGTDLDLLRDKICAADFVVTVSEFNRAYLESLVRGPGATTRRSWIVPPDRRRGSGEPLVRRLYNGVDLELFVPSVGARREDVVLALGRLVEKKGFDDLVRAWPVVCERLPGARLIVVGDGPERRNLEALADRLGVADRIEWAGAEPQDRIRDRLATAALCCLPCRVGKDGNRDGLPTVLLEALASGVPCVSTSITGVPEIIRDGVEGRIVPPGDVDALSEALIELLRDGDGLRRMGRAARTRAEERFDLRANVGHLAEWFGERP